ncbi:HflK protein [Desulfosarcina widdelii]|uniref:Protein HflK n=1 Tax=Desulfosarcina widdelii TaxID=947919 RepID=A0A5K7ZLI7_9BACT|nr:FtsH protease activity modulator HflK [Desulfosarcina widdelii]BBO79154.1 HflK protein [Desulfosarcina widdelii]
MAWDWEKLNRQHQQQPGGVPPQMDDLVNQLKKFKPPGGSLLIIAVVVILMIGYSVFFTIESGSVGVVQQFGKFVRIAQPGPNFKLPFGIEKVTKVRQDRVYKEEFGFQSERGDYGGGRYSGASDTASIALMLTGDLNVAVVPWIVQYRIKDPYNYLFKVKDPTGLLRDLSESSMRLVVGDRSINEVITKRDEIAVEAQRVLQAELNKAETGINVVTVEMKKTNVPTPVQPSFNEVNQATQEKEKMIYQAREDYNKAIPAARGEAERTIKAAEGYALDRINRAKGDAARFSDLYSEYIKAKDVTKRRLYLESLKELLPKIDRKFIVDADQKNVLPLLNLGNNGGGIK